MNTPKSNAFFESLPPSNPETNELRVFDLEDETPASTDRLLFKTPDDFSQFIQLASIKEGRSCTSIVLEYCDERDLEPEDISKLISRSLKEKIMLEMQEDGLLQKVTPLEFE